MMLQSFLFINPVLNPIIYLKGKKTKEKRKRIRKIKYRTKITNILANIGITKYVVNYYEIVAETILCYNMIIIMHEMHFHFQ